MEYREEQMPQLEKVHRLTQIIVEQEENVELAKVDNIEVETSSILKLVHEKKRDRVVLELLVK